MLFCTDASTSERFSEGTSLFGITRSDSILYKDLSQCGHAYLFLLYVSMVNVFVYPIHKSVFLSFLSLYIPGPTLFTENVTGNLLPL